MDTGLAVQHEAWNSDPQNILKYQKDMVAHLSFQQSESGDAIPSTKWLPQPARSTCSDFSWETLSQ